MGLLFRINEHVGSTCGDFTSNAITITKNVYSLIASCWVNDIVRHCCSQLLPNLPKEHLHNCEHSQIHCGSLHQQQNEWKMAHNYFQTMCVCVSKGS